MESNINCFSPNSQLETDWKVCLTTLRENRFQNSNTAEDIIEKAVEAIFKIIKNETNKNQQVDSLNDLKSKIKNLNNDGSFNSKQKIFLMSKINDKLTKEPSDKKTSSNELAKNIEQHINTIIQHGFSSKKGEALERDISSWLFELPEEMRQKIIEQLSLKEIIELKELSSEFKAYISDSVLYKLLEKKALDKGATSLSRLKFALHQGKENVKVLDLKRIDIIDVNIDELQKSCPNLEDIAFPIKATEVFIQDFVEKFPKLKKVTLLPNQNLSPHFLEFLTKNCKHLEGLHWSLAPLSSDAINNIASTWKEQLTELTIDIKEDSSLSPLANHCPNLESLTLSGTISNDNQSIYELAQKCQKIKSINISFPLEGTFIKNLVNNQNKKGTLIFISIPKLQNMQDHVLMQLARKNLGLEVLDLGGCQGLTDKFLQALVVCKGLKNLNLKGANFSPKSIDTLTKSLNQLQTIDLNSCPNLDDKTLENIARNCPNLSILYIKNCKKITKEGLEKFLQISPQSLEFVEIPAEIDESTIKRREHIFLI